MSDEHTKQIDRQTMTAVERDNLLHTEVLGLSLLCSGYLEGYSEWRCSGCGATFGNIKPKSHNVTVPPYSTSLDAAWLIVEKMRERLYSQRRAYLSILQYVVTERHAFSTGSLAAWPDVLWLIDAQDYGVAALRALGWEVVV